MKKFTKQELKIISIIILLVSVAYTVNIRVSLRRGRDATRKDDMFALQGALGSYINKYHVFPDSIDGKIAGCFSDETTFDEQLGRYVNLRSCEWGVDSFEDFSTMPRDPKAKEGVDYLYFSNGKRYQIYVSLEGTDEDEYTPEIEALNLQCGTKVCNYGRGYSVTPVTISLDEYEQILESQKE